MDIVIRLLKYDNTEISDCAELAAACFGDDCRQACYDELWDMFRMMSSHPPVYMVALDGDEVVGLGGYGQSLKSHAIYDMFWLCVKESYRGKGVGRMLSEARINAIKAIPGACRIEISADVTQEGLITYHTKMGFTTDGSYSERGARSFDHVLMSIQLK